MKIYGIVIPYAKYDLVSRMNALVECKRIISALFYRLCHKCVSITKPSLFLIGTPTEGVVSTTTMSSVYIRWTLSKFLPYQQRKWIISFNFVWQKQHNSRENVCMWIIKMKSKEFAENNLHVEWFLSNLIMLKPFEWWAHAYTKLLPNEEEKRIDAHTPKSKHYTTKWKCCNNMWIWVKNSRKSAHNQVLSSTND